MSRYFHAVGNGRCGGLCGRAIEPGRSMCDTCLSGSRERVKAAQNARLAAGMCVIGNHPRDREGRYCTACLDRVNGATRRYRARQRGENAPKMLRGARGDA